MQVRAGSLCGRESGSGINQGDPYINDDFDESVATELTADEEALLQEMPTLTDVGQARRTFLEQTIASGLGALP
jgi:hypothetical protein